MARPGVSSSPWTQRRVGSRRGTALAKSRGDVRCDGRARRALRAARLLSRLRRVPGEPLGAGFARTGERHDRRSLPRRPHPTPQGAAPRPGRNPGPAGPCARLCRRQHGRGCGRALRHRRRARPARGSRLHVPRRAGSGGSIGLSADCAAYQRRLSALRCVERAPAQGAAGCGCGLCRRRTQALKDYSRERGEAVLQIAHQIK